MSRNVEYKFVETDSSAIEAELISRYETITGHTLQPADPDRLFIAWIANMLIQERVNQNYIGNQNIPSRAEGENLDALGKWIFSLERKAAQAAKCTVRFNISEAQSTAITIPAGTRVSDISQKLIWDTTEDVLIAIGDTYVDVMVECETAGTVGNGYAAGQINQLIDVDNVLYYSSCANTTESDGGTEEEDDDAYYEMMRSVMDSYSTAGAEGSYIYHAKTVSDEIADVKAVRPKLSVSKTITVYEHDGDSFAFIGGEQIDTDTLKVYPPGSTVAAVLDTDYTVSYSDGLITISIEPGEALDGKTSLDVTFEQVRGGYVYIYALMNDGTIATSTIKNAIADTCSADYVRPLTDYVTVQDPEEVTYNITCTYYISNETQLSLSDITAAVDNAVNEYVKWQYAKLGRDINPSKLQSLLMQTGIKRVVITSPTFTTLRSGANNDVPQIAQVGTITVTNGGYEDE